jgi:hypothetical protein
MATRKREPLRPKLTKVVELRVIVSHPVRAKRGRMTGSAKQSRNLAAEKVWIASALTRLAMTTTL